MVCVFKHLYCSTQLSMSNMEKRYRNKIIIIIIMIMIIIKTVIVMIMKKEMMIMMTATMMMMIMMTAVVVAVVVVVVIVVVMMTMMKMLMIIMSCRGTIPDCSFHSLILPQPGSNTDAHILNRTKNTCSTRKALTQLIQMVQRVNGCIPETYLTLSLDIKQPANNNNNSPTCCSLL